MIHGQMSLFDGNQEFHNDKPIRLIQLFAGYGSQLLAFKYLGMQVEDYKISEFAVKSIQAYKDMHFPEDDTDYSQDKSADEIRSWLNGKISADYNTPMSEQQINRLSEKQVRTIYNNMQATHNLGSITEIKAEDLAVVDTDKFCYILTYSYPCQDVSNAGKQAGMAKDSGTRSALLWEVERLLRELKETESLPQILLMENVPQVHSEGNKQDFYAWIRELEELGYHNYWKDLNAKDYGIPQNRNRCFMISLLGDYYYSFPKPQKLTVRLKDFLDKRVDEKYYLNLKAIQYILDANRKCDNTKRGDLGDRKVNPEIAKAISCRGAADQRADVTNFVVNDNSVEYSIDELRESIFNIEPRIAAMRGRNPDNPSDRTAGSPTEQRLEIGGGETSNTLTTVQKDNLVVEPNYRFFEQAFETLQSNECEVGDTIDAYNKKVNKDGISPTLTTRPEGFKTAILPITQDYRIRKLTERECFRLMGVKGEDFERVRYGMSLPNGSPQKIVNRTMTKAEWKECWRIMRHDRQSTSSCYHLAGDAIAVSVLMALFGQLFGIDYNSKITELIGELRQ